MNSGAHTVLDKASASAKMLKCKSKTYEDP